LLQTWSYGKVRRTAFFPVCSDGTCDLVNAVLPEAITRGQSIQTGDELHVTGFVRNADMETSLATIANGIKLP
jgi:hypothetical protein